MRRGEREKGWKKDGGRMEGGERVRIFDVLLGLSQEELLGDTLHVLLSSILLEDGGLALRLHAFTLVLVILVQQLSLRGSSLQMHLLSLFVSGRRQLPLCEGVEGIEGDRYR